MTTINKIAIDINNINKYVSGKPTGLTTQDEKANTPIPTLIPPLSLSNEAMSRIEDFWVQLQSAG